MTDFAELESLNSKPDSQTVNDKFVDDSIMNKLQLEAELLYSGFKQGVGQRLNEMAENPGSTALQITAAAAIGLGMTALRTAEYERTSRFAALGISILAGLDLGFRLKESSAAMKSVWNDATTFDASRDQIANNFGSLLVDYPLLFASGYQGSRFIVQKIPTYSKNILSPQYRLGPPVRSWADFISLPPVVSAPMEK